MRAVPGFMVEQERKRLRADLDLIRSHGGLDTDRSVVRIQAQLEILDSICARVEVECLTGSPPTPFRRFAQDYTSAFR